jgi:hypothetical protein
MSDAEFLLVITLKQPWATWVLWGWKIVETRIHNQFGSLLNKRIGIHAGLTMDHNAMIVAAPYLTADQMRRSVEHQHVCGALLCTAFVHRYAKYVPASCSKHALISCYVPRSGLWLGAVEPFTPPIPMRGHQGIWKAPYPLGKAA